MRCTMPSHTFTRVGFWEESAATTSASENTALQQNVIGEALHAMDYQIYAYLQMARERQPWQCCSERRQRWPSWMSRGRRRRSGAGAGVYATSAIAARHRRAWRMG